VGLGEFTEARPEGERGVATSAALSSPPGECLWYCGLGTRGPERRKRAGKIVQIFHPPHRPALINRPVTQTWPQTVVLTRLRSGDERLAYKKGVETRTHTGTATAESREQGFTTGSEEERNLDGHPLQSQWPGPSLGESQINNKLTSSLQ